MVRNFSFDLINHLRKGTKLKYTWKLPDWVLSNKDLILLKLEHDFIVDRYTRYHDVGKPFCLNIDGEGKQHFPNHAAVSEEIYRKYVSKKDTVVRRLIKYDMDIHCLKSDGVEEFCKRREAITSLIVGLAEIHANADMFGGLDSISFKIKWKHINKRGSQILKIMNKIE